MIKGIHHITAIASNAADTIYFYTKILGLRLVKKTVNQDDTSTYHLFFGDTEGHPGMDLTFFIFLPSVQGKRGTGLVTTISLAVPDTSLSFWEQRFTEYKVKHEHLHEKFNKKRIIFFDQDDQKLELVGISPEEQDPQRDVWTKEIAQENAIQNFYSATLSVVSHATIEPILTQVFGHEKIMKSGNDTLYQLKDSKRAEYLEISEEPSSPFGFNAAGTVHHIAFRVKSESEQLELRNRVQSIGLFPTDVINRYYFKSVYFRTPGGILFEIATDEPGFTADEQKEHLGEKLSLPPFLENERQETEKNLPPISKGSDA